MFQKHHNSLLEKGISGELVKLEQQIAEEEKKLSFSPDQYILRMQESKGDIIRPNDEIVFNLRERSERLKMLSKWLQEDVQLSVMIDSLIGNQVKQTELRLKRFNVLYNFVFLMLGWLLSAFGSPITLVHFIFH